MREYPGVVIAIVKDLDDPENEGRIQVEFPWLEEGQRSAWAPIATMMAGQGRGSFFMPEPEDEVLVAFEHGDFDHPFIIGFLWNGQDTPPHDDINRSVRRLRTVSGHTIDFDDNDGQNRVLIKSSSGHEMEMKDSDPKSVTIKTIGGQQIEMKDTPAGIEIKTSAGNSVKISDTPSSIDVRTASGNSVTISDAPPSITLSVMAGTLTVNCLQANVTASSLLNITAPMTVFSGVIQTPAIIANAVIGSAYTPAPGNTFGL